MSAGLMIDIVQALVKGVLNYSSGRAVQEKPSFLLPNADRSVISDHGDRAAEPGASRSAGSASWSPKKYLAGGGVSKGSS